MRNVIIVVLGIVLIVLLVIFNYKTKNYFDNKNRIDNNLQQLKSYELELNYDVLKISFFFYTNLDNIKNDETKIDYILNLLEKEPSIRNDKQLYEEFKEYKKAISNKIDESYKFETNAIPVKNANMYLIKLLGNCNNNLINNKNYTVYVNKILSNILFFKNTFDKSFIVDLNKNINILKSFKLNKEDEKFNTIFIKNVNIMNSYFPKYNNYLNEILNSKSMNKLKKLHKDFLEKSNKKLIVITLVSFLLIGFIIFVMILVLYLFYKVDKENELLEKLSITDDLTGLYNRRKFQDDNKNIQNPILLIVNIDRFKYYNELYGIEVGDFVLQEVAKIIGILLCKTDVYIYRLGADDFGILGQKNKIDAEKLSKAIINYFKNNIIEFNNLEFNISVSIGISEFEPLIETADIALKETKKDLNKYYKIYNPKIGYIEKIKDNVQKLKILKTAIENDNIIPYFQPIWDNKTGEVIKYEVLARVINGSKIESIYQYLDIAKENKLYKYITEMIYKKAFEKFKGTDIEFSLNIGISDLNEPETMGLINNLFTKYPKIIKNITFEILEDDAIKNYNILKEFITFVKSKGCHIALDDFGSGYSNFAHVLNLNIDFLKIDGSLIKFLPEDERMQIIIETIVNFSKKMNIKTIAEFVASKEIYEKVKELNIDYTQGFYLGEPENKLVGE